MPARSANPVPAPRDRAAAVDPALLARHALEAEAS
jgi:hypothetical protein